MLKLTIGQGLQLFKKFTSGNVVDWITEEQQTIYSLSFKYFSGEFFSSKIEKKSFSSGNFRNSSWELCCCLKRQLQSDNVNVLLNSLCG